MPTARTRVGDFSDFRDAAGNLIRIYDPLTTRLNPAFDAGRPVSATNPQFLRDPFPDNVIPAGRFNPVGRNIASIYPLPNGDGNFNNYTSTVNREVTDNSFSGRIDHQLSSKDSFFARFNWGKFKLDAPQGQAACCLPTPAEAASRFDLGPFVAGIQNTRLTTHGAAFNYSRVLTSTFVNELRVGYAKTIPFTFPSDFGIRAAESLGVRGINVSEYTTGLPNINIPDLTGISGGPAFLPVNPKQYHWQAENALVWLRGRHQLKFGYRLVDRYPSPFTNTDTRGSINFGRNYTNNPVNNSGGSGLASLLTGYINSASRGFLLEPYTLRTQEHGLFIQDDVKLSARVTMNAGIRYEIFKAETEQDDRIVNFDLAGLRLIYAGEDGASQVGQQEDALRQHRAAARADLRPARQRHDHPAHRLRHHLLPGAALGVEHDRAAGAVHDLAERQLRDQPDRLRRRPHDRRSVPADRAGEAADDRGAAGGEPPGRRPLVRERDALRRAVAPGHRAPPVHRDGGGDDVCRQRRQAHRVLLQPERSAAGDRLAGIAAAAPAAQPGEQHRAVRSAEPVHLPQRPAQGDAAFPRAACSSSAATPTARRSTTAAPPGAAAARSATRRPSPTSRRGTGRPDSTCATAPSSAGCGSCRGARAAAGRGMAAWSARWPAAGSSPASARSRPGGRSPSSCRPA